MESAQAFLEHVEDLTDLELAVLLSLVAQHHCMVVTTGDLLDDLASELALIVRDMFNLSYIILDRDDLQSINAFGAAILDDDNADDDGALYESDADVANPGMLSPKLASVDFRAAPSSLLERSKLDTRKVVNVVIAKDFNYAHQDVQIQALDLIRRRRVYSRTTVHLAPKTFLLLPLVTTSSKHIRLNKHLSDRIFMSHSHSAEDGFPNLEELDGAASSEDHGSGYSYSHSPSARRQETIASRRIDAKLIEQLRAQSQATTVTPEIRRYLQDVVVFLRMERGVDGGISPYATTLFLALAKYLAPFHGIDYVTPSLVALAAKKIYPHRIIMATSSRERSTQYGTDLASAHDLLNDLDPEKVIQNVLDTIECPT
ncbi:hypothetical protein A1O7_08824 [Cladophialophora yegresii CBS 114405]|uniref:magnesium chelatase n=1 Tax=Cladophialophora yegresii CBS 114405 TaxID=1182544 RepID=W9VK76_9EURO|nr:uncharacterized protein A1O7_08824 [Cladophialophora yegresii CBS 114405]EXJ55893.1 hypothetical protein A1O7_08824 [Cladophialophora yegresii CBS 114405]